MALLDLSNVSRLLIRLIQEAITVSPAWDGSTPTVSPLPPDRLGDEGDLLGFYLYHVGEDPHSRNNPTGPSATSPVALAPMGLILHYQLTAHTAAQVDDPSGLYKIQLLFGLALKALHDHPIIVDATEVNGLPLLAAFGLHDRDNQFRLILRPVAVEDAVTYWTAGQGPARLAAYYQISVVMLEPEPAATYVSPVLDHGVTVFLSGPPHLAGSRSFITFTMPGQSTPRTITTSPAQVPIGGRFTLFGTDLVGDATDLVIERRDGDGEHTVDAIAWQVVVSSSELAATVQPTAGAQDVIPGIYSAAVAVKRTASGRELTQISNRTAIVVIPTVSDPGQAAPGDVLTLTGSVFQHADIPSDPEDHRAVQVILGATALVRGTIPLDPGEIAVTDASTITLRLPTEVEAGFLPLRVRVNGAESSPRWVEVT